MKARPSNRIQDIFREGKAIDSALKRAAAFAKKNAETSALTTKNKSSAREKPAK